MDEIKGHRWLQGIYFILKYIDKEIDEWIQVLV